MSRIAKDYERANVPADQLTTLLQEARVATEQTTRQVVKARNDAFEASVRYEENLKMLVGRQVRVISAWIFDSHNYDAEFIETVNEATLTIHGILLAVPTMFADRKAPFAQTTPGSERGFWLEITKHTILDPQTPEA